MKWTGKRRRVYPALPGFLLLLLLALCLLTGCQAGSENRIPEIGGETFSSVFEPDYAEHFRIYEYRDGFMLAELEDRYYLLVPEGQSVPDGLPQNVTVIQKPLQHAYMAASAVMSLFDALGGTERVQFSAVQEPDWYVKGAAVAMQAGTMRYAGKYSQPDYEMLLEGDCDLAVESTMILHSPDVQEKLEELGIPVWIDCSSHEADPLGRVEWIRLYGRLLDCEEAADAFFQEQVEKVRSLAPAETMEKEVAFFFLDTSGQAVVRKSEDYIPRMIQMAGGSYVFRDLKQEAPENRSGSVRISMESFYEAAGDADILIYNATIDQPLESLDDLIAKDALFSGFRAVQTGNVWTTDRYLYQATDLTADFIVDIHRVLTGEPEANLTFLHRVGSSRSESAGVS